MNQDKLDQWMVNSKTGQRLTFQQLHDRYYVDPTAYRISLQSDHIEIYTATFNGEVEVKNIEEWYPEG